MRDLVLAVDPGGTTGWATWRDGELTLAGQSDFEKFTYMVDAWAEGLSSIVCERYVVTAQTLKKSRQSTATEVIGFLRYIALREDIPFTLQSPGDAKKFADNARLDAAGWRQVSSLDHANDAIRHLILYLVKLGRMAVPR